MASTTHVPAAPDRPTAPRSRRRRVRDRLGVWGFRLAVVGLVGLNLWWFVRDRQPVLDLKALRGLIDNREYVEAESELRERLRRSPHDDEARMLLARSLAGQGRMLACAEELHRVPFWSPRKPEARFLEGQAFLEVGRARDAEPALRASVEDDPLHPTPDNFHKAATDMLIGLYVTEQRWDDAQEVVWKTYERANREDRAAALVMYLRTEVERIDPASVVEKLRRYVAADPEDFEARRALAKAEQALGRPAEATAQIQACLAARPDDLEVWRDWLAILQERGDTAALAEAVARLPKPASGDYDAPTWEAIGRVREAAGDHPGAAEAYRKAVLGQPHDADYHYRLALVEARLGNRDEARDHLDRSKVLRQARTDLVDAVIAYREALATGLAADPRVVEAAAKVEELCRTIGLNRAADALAATHRRAG
jgi:tetratricopeptide (TPR) repeat protein